MYCEFCNEHPATVFITQIAENEVTQLRLCEACARQRAQAIGEEGAPALDEVVFGFFDDQEYRSEELIFDQDESSDEDEFTMNEVFMSLQNQPFDDDEFADEDSTDELDELDGESDLHDVVEGLAAALEDGEGSGDDIFGLSLDELTKSSPFADTPLSPAPERREVAARRCPKCSITWDRLRQDGRAGCAHCYETFADQLHDVMQRMQHAPQHHGKKPRAAEKRRNRLEHLRARRDHRLAMLHRRLDEAVRSEKYEEAAKLRDQIKMVSSTIIQES